MNVLIKQNATRYITLTIGRYISDNDYGSISTIKKIQKVDIILLNGKVIIKICSILICC